MKTKYQLGSLILSALFMLSSCQKEENMNTSSNAEPLSVNFTLGGSAGIVGNSGASRTTPIHSDEEKAVKTLWAIAFEDADRTASAMQENPVADTDKFYRAIEIALPAEMQGTGSLSFSFLLDKAGFFQICFIANPDAALTNFFNKLTPGSSTVADLKNHITTTKACDDKTNGLLMTSAFYPVESSWTTAAQIGQVNLTRAMARIDVKNQIEGMNIYQIDFLNRASNTKLYQGNTVGLEAGITLENKTYSDLTVNGKGSECKEQIYTYEQKATTTTDSDKIPALKIYYTTDADPDTQRYHTIQLVYSNEGREPVAVGLKRNYLYTVTLTRKASNITANLEVLDWNKGAEVGVKPDEIGGGTTLDKGNGIAKNPGNGGTIDVFE